MFFAANAHAAISATCQRARTAGAGWLAQALDVSAGASCKPSSTKSNCGQWSATSGHRSFTCYGTHNRDPAPMTLSAGIIPDHGQKQLPQAARNARLNQTLIDAAASRASRKTHSLMTQMQHRARAKAFPLTFSRELNGQTAIRCRDQAWCTQAATPVGRVSKSLPCPIPDHYPRRRVGSRACQRWPPRRWRFTTAATMNVAPGRPNPMLLADIYDRRDRELTSDAYQRTI